MVECNLAKVDVASSNLVSRSTEARVIPGFFIGFDHPLQTTKTLGLTKGLTRGSERGRFDTVRNPCHLLTVALLVLVLEQRDHPFMSPALLLHIDVAVVLRHGVAAVAH